MKEWLAKRIVTWLYPRAMRCRVCEGLAVERVQWGGYQLNLCAQHREEWHFTANASSACASYLAAQIKMTAMKNGLLPFDELVVSEYFATERDAGDVVRRWLEDEALA